MQQHGGRLTSKHVPPANAAGPYSGTLFSRGQFLQRDSCEHRLGQRRHRQIMMIIVIGQVIGQVLWIAVQSQVQSRGLRFTGREADC